MNMLVEVNFIWVSPSDHTTEPKKCRFQISKSSRCRTITYDLTGEGNAGDRPMGWPLKTKTRCLAWEATGIYQTNYMVNQEECLGPHDVLHVSLIMMCVFCVVVWCCLSVNGRVTEYVALRAKKKWDQQRVFHDYQFGKTFSFTVHSVPSPLASRYAIVFSRFVTPIASYVIELGSFPALSPNSFNDGSITQCCGEKTQGRGISPNHHPIFIINQQFHS